MGIPSKIQLWGHLNGLGAFDHTFIFLGQASGFPKNLPRGSFSDVAVMFFSAMSQVKNDNFRAIIEPFLTHSYVPDPVLDL